MKEFEPLTFLGKQNYRNILEKQSMYLVDPNEMIETWFQSGTNVILWGYNHDILLVHKFMGEKLLPALSQIHITNIFLETSCTWQADFDHFRETGVYSDEWNKDLQFVLGLSGKQEDKRFLFESIRNYPDLKLTFIDAPEDRQTGRRLPLKISRDQFMYEKIVQNRPNGKFLVICGSHHAETTDSERGRFAQLIKNPKLDTLGMRLRNYSGYKTKSLIATDFGTNPLCELREYLNSISPDQSQPFAVDFQRCLKNRNNVIRKFKYRHQYLPHVFDGLILYPYSRPW
jgi:hypothetical protein